MWSHVSCLCFTARSACTIQRSIEATENKARRVPPASQGDVCGIVVISFSTMYFITELLLSVSRGCPSCSINMVQLRSRRRPSITKLVRESSPILIHSIVDKATMGSRQRRALRFQGFQEKDDATSLTSDIRPGYRCHEAQYEVIANTDLHEAKQALSMQGFSL